MVAEILRGLGVLPYPMMWDVTPHTSGFRRWVLSHYDKKVDWAAWLEAKCQPRNINAKQLRLV
jgi:hypothetical protein